jgi:hypothetical protein
MILSILANRKIVYISFFKVFRSQRLLNYIEFTTRVSFIKICKQWQKLELFLVMMIVKMKSF